MTYLEDFLKAVNNFNSIDFESLDLPMLIDLAGKATEFKKICEAHLTELKSHIASKVEFSEDSNTTRDAGHYYEVTIQKKTSTKYDQPKLNALRAKIGDEEFFKVFKWTFEPTSKKVLDGALEFSSYKERLAEAVTEQAPYITFKPLESV